MSVTVGTLTIDLKANTASFSGSMDKMSHLSAKTASDIKRSLERIATVGLAMSAAIATGTAALISHSFDAADALYKLSQSMRHDDRNPVRPELRGGPEQCLE